MRRAALYLLTVSVLAHAADVSAQQQPTVRPGAWVRLTCPEAELERATGTVVDIRSDTLVLLLAKPQAGPRIGGMSISTETDVPLPTVTRLDVHRGRKSYATYGTAIGAIIGAGLGAAAGVAVAEFCIIDCPSVSSSEKLRAGVLGAVIGAVPFAFTGMFVGSLIHGDRWERVPLHQLRLQPVATSDRRFGLAASVRF